MTITSRLLRLLVFVAVAKIAAVIISVSLVNLPYAAEPAGPAVAPQRSASAAQGPQAPRDAYGNDGAGAAARPSVPALDCARDRWESCTPPITEERGAADPRDRVIGPY
ncbi:MAG TPA: hypothetical protein VKF35_22200 [Hyphomicrobiaceae bacterium]|nr:hypothetical protein [Hyphomicrobiaceae bacterium]